MKRYLVLENGEVFAGLALGAPCDTFGELVFTTGMNGYIETLTDPSYCGQIVLQTFPLIGNYGIIPADFEGKCCVRGYVVREACSTPSNFRCAQTLDAFLKENNIPGITGIDTRAVTRILREAGCTFFRESPTNQQFVVLDNAQVEALAERVRFSTWEKLGDGRTVIRLVTSWSTTPDDLAALKAALHEVL